MTCVAVDIGGTKIAASAVDGDGKVVGPVRTRPTPAAEGPAVVLATVIDLVSELLASSERFKAIGISSAGVIDSNTGTVLSATSHIRGWAGTEIASTVRNQTSLPTYVLNDGHAFALGEALHGVGRAYESVLVLAAGTGIGGSFVSGSEPMFGARWAAGHFGHVSVAEAAGIPCYCGRTGHLEAVAGGAGILRWYHSNGGSRAITSTRELFTRRDDDLASYAIATGAAAFGTALGGLVNSFDPGIAVYAGGLANSGERWEQPMRRAYEATLIDAVADVPLRRSHADDWQALKGAAYFAEKRNQEWIPN